MLLEVGPFRRISNQHVVGWSSPALLEQASEIQFNIGAHSMR